MGTVKWRCYKPSDINWHARSLVEAWSRHDRDIETGGLREQKNHTGQGILFAIITAGMLVITWLKFM